MTLEIVTPTDNRWDEVFYSFEEQLQDPFLSSGYFNLQEDKTKQFACIIQDEKQNTFFYPFIKSEINKFGYHLDNIYYDIQGVYGYNGAIIQSNSNSFIKKSRTLFEKYCKDENIIAEFVRFNTIYENHLYFKDISLIKINKSIILDLTKDDIWKNEYAHSTRKNINKAIKNNLSHRIIKAKEITEDEIDSFFTIYTQTMKRNNANKEYYHSKEYFQSFKKHLPNNALFAFIYKEKRVISVEVILYNNFIAYSFLGGTISDFFKFRPNDYLKHIIIARLKEMNLQYFCLGGGVTLDDGIYKYKKCFSKNGIYDFYIGKKIYNENIYTIVTKQWENKTTLEKQNKYSKYLLKYHY